MKPLLLILAFVLLLGGRDVRAQEATGALEWPATTNVNRPWTRWWWQGNAVDENNLTAALEAYREAGLCGVEDAARYVASETYELSGGERLEQPVRMEQEPLLRVIGIHIQLPSGTKGHPLQQAGRDEM